MTGKTVLYFSPHQDDELLSMGIGICNSVSRGMDVHIILCTDGSKCPVRTKLAVCNSREMILKYLSSIGTDSIVCTLDTNL